MPRLTPLVAAYCQYRQTYGGIADRTLQHDVQVAQEFLGVLRRQGRSVRQVTIVDLDAFVARHRQHLAIRTVLDRCSALRSFLRFLPGRHALSLRRVGITVTRHRPSSRILRAPARYTLLPKAHRSVRDFQAAVEIVL